MLKTFFSVLLLLLLTTVADGKPLNQSPWARLFPGSGGGIGKPQSSRLLSPPSQPANNVRVVSDYFACWNARDMEAAISQFDDNCVYEDTLYPNVFQGKQALKAHLDSVALSLPDTFRFCIDEISEDTTRGTVGIQWHVEDGAKPLPFTRGTSLYTVKNGLIVKGFDVPEPVVKSGAISLALLRSATPFIKQPARLVPLIAFFLYSYFLFFSDATPGVNALTFDPATWEEVKNLSLNFWFIVPSLAPDQAPEAHPVLEGIFNLVIAYASLFLGFLPAERRLQQGYKLSTLSFGWTLLVMQFLTNAAYLPYLVSRRDVDAKAIRELAPKIDPSLGLLEGIGVDVDGNGNGNSNGNGASTGRESGQQQQQQQQTQSLTFFEKVASGPVVPLFFGGIAIASFAWAANARPEYGDLQTRLTSFFAIASTDRLSFSFVIDIIYFAFFQGWLIDGDAALRSKATLSDAQREELAKLVVIGKNVPLVGLILYLLKRPEL